eukprot:TRINITY_DN8485_c0_g1_i2.p2 TRINITY_DN8485_c0_g1~~TRINITY_DN8485_c0_g1_i2.p2  ORF type:complete len:206 (-),score=39.73 TRINITY_DN8485_c0_g1_i2:756-1373(-)
MSDALFLSKQPSASATGPPIKQGYLTKQGGVIKNWKKRWFILTKTSQLYYYREKGDLNAAGSIQITDRTLVQEASKKSGRPFSFEISAGPESLTTSKERSYLLVASSQAEMDEWMAAIHAAASGGDSTKPDPKFQQKGDSATLYVRGIMCSCCEDKVKGILSKTQGIKSFELKLRDEEVKIIGRPDLADLVSVLEESGYIVSTTI